MQCLEVQKLDLCSWELELQVHKFDHEMPHIQSRKLDL